LNASAAGLNWSEGRQQPTTRYPRYAWRSNCSSKGGNRAPVTDEQGGLQMLAAAARPVKQLPLRIAMKQRQ
jgi:hypothetical protein